MSEVTLSGKRAKVVSSSPTSIVVVASRGVSYDAVLGDVVIITNSQSEIRGANMWTYIQPGDIDSVVPAIGQYGDSCIRRECRDWRGRDRPKECSICNIKKSRSLTHSTGISA